MKFSKHADHYAVHLEKVMQTDWPWAAKIAYAVAILAEARDGAESETKADMNKILAHGLDLLVAQGVAEKTEDGAYVLIRGERPPKPESMKIDAAEQPEPKPKQKAEPGPRPEVA